MNLQSKRLVAITAGATLFTFIFWDEKLALNALLYDLLMIPVLLLFSPGSLKNKTVLLLLLGHFICTADVIIHNTLLSKIGFCFTLLVTTAFIQYKHRSPWYAGGTVLLKFLFGLSAMIKDFAAAIKSPREKKKMKWGKIIRFAIFPMLLLVIFFTIYAAANPVFSGLFDKFLSSVQEFIGRFFDVISIGRILFFVLGFYITGVLVEHADRLHFSNRDLACDDVLTKKKHPIRRGILYELSHLVYGRAAYGMLALKTQNTTGIISLTLLNILLFAVNCVDIRYIWFHFEYSPDKPIWKMVHEGTELLILSILAAMAILLFLFKGNLNFYKKNKWLKYGAYAWIIQNGFLVLSVFLRDYYYIEYSGLAYKRIGVLFYLAMVLIGLVTMFIKITRHKTTYHLLKVNAWAAIVLLTVSCCVHWDETIASYNIKHRDTIALDTQFLLSLSDKTLPLIDKNRDVLMKTGGNIFYTALLQSRIEQFKAKEQQYSWLSWNYADDYVRHYFQDKQSVTIK
ncbi:DUF4153 domain-containing protein [Chitinophagaceae bacterium MMS25-I14]